MPLQQNNLTKFPQEIKPTLTKPHAKFKTKQNPEITKEKKGPRPRTQLRKIEQS